MSQTLSIRVVRQACGLLGPEELAERVSASRALVQAWLLGQAEPPPGAFLKMLRLLRAADPSYRPFALEQAL